MAKLFEEVVNSSALASSSADIWINFAGSDTSMASMASIALAAATPAQASTSPGRGGVQTSPAHRCVSPNRSPRSSGSASCRANESLRADVAAALPAGAAAAQVHSSGACSPTRACSEPLVTSTPAFLRCHSLVLQTQPSLLRALQANAVDGHAMSVASAATSPPEPTATAMECGELVRDLIPSVDSIGSTLLQQHDDGYDRRPPTADAYVSRPSLDPRRCSRDSDSPRAGMLLVEKPMMEVTVDDEPEVFLEMIKFVYTNICSVDQGNVKALLQIADKYVIEDIICICLQWMQDHFTANRFYSFLTYKLSNDHFQQLVWQSLLLALRSRRHFMLVTEDGEGRWEQLPLPFVEALLSCNELPVVSEGEVLQLLSRWAAGRLSRMRGESTATDGASSSQAHEVQDQDPDSGTMDQGVTNMLRLLRTLRRSDMSVKMGDLDPILELLQLNSLFSTKPPRESASLDPGFTVYHSTGVNVPTPFVGGLSQADPPMQQAWLGTSVTLGSQDYIQQQDGFKACKGRAVEGSDGLIMFPRLRVGIECHAWSHREKRSSMKASSGHGRPISRASSGADDTAMSSLAPVTEASPVSVPLPAVPGKAVQSQDDWEIGKVVRAVPNLSTTLRDPSMELDGRRSSVPNFGDHEKIDHKVVCAVISGHVRHGIRIGQRERSSIYEVEELSGQSDEICIGGSPTEVDFELQLTAQAPNVFGILRCSLAVLPTGAPDTRPPKDPLMEIVFDASAEEQLHFHVSSSHFDSNSSYVVSLNWVLRPGPPRP